MRTFFLLILCLMLSACSDGDSSSGSGGDGSSNGDGGGSGGGSSSSGGGADDPDQNSLYAGTYNGRLRAVARTETLGTIREAYDFVAVVNRNNRLRFRDEDGDVNVVTTVNDQGQFSFQFSPDSSVCTGTIDVNGKIVGDIMDGTLAGPAKCKIGSTTVNGRLTGTFSGTR